MCEHSSLLAQNVFVYEPVIFTRCLSTAAVFYEKRMETESRNDSFPTSPNLRVLSEEV